MQKVMITHDNAKSAIWAIVPLGLKYSTRLFKIQAIVGHTFMKGVV